MSPPAAEISGRLEGPDHVYPLRVYYEDTDAGGVVYHANYLKFAERGRTEMLRLLGINQREMASRYGMAFAVRALSMDFRRSARLDDDLEVHTRLVELRGASIGVEQAVRRGAETLVGLVLRIVCLRPQGRPTRVPEAVRTTLEPYIQMPEQD